MTSRRKHFQCPFKQLGFGIVEIMVALTVGLILMTGVIKVYDSGRRSYRMTENLSRMQESARFAMTKLTRDVRMAGFLPCRLTGNVANTLNSANTFFDFFTGSLMGYEGGISTFPTEFPAVGTSPGDRVVNTDAIVVLRGDDESYTITHHNPTSAQFKLNNLHTLQDGDILLVCDAQDAAIFQATNVSSSNVTVVHNTGTGDPGNCSKNIGGEGDCTDPSGLEPHTYGPGSQLVKFVAYGYYIGVSKSGTTRSLYRKHLTVDNATLTAAFESEELLEDIENMQFLYGVDADGDTVADQYVTANNVATWNDVVSVRAGLLVHTPDQINASNDTNRYNVAGTPIDDSGTTVTHDADRRLRYVFSSTIKVRNRGIN